MSSLKILAAYNRFKKVTIRRAKAKNFLDKMSFTLKFMSTVQSVSFEFPFKKIKRLL